MDTGGTPEAEGGSALAGAGWSGALARATGDGVLELDPVGTVVAADDDAARVVGRPRTALVGESLEGLLAPADREAVSDRFAELSADADGGALAPPPAEPGDGGSAPSSSLSPSPSPSPSLSVAVETPAGERRDCALRLAPVRTDAELAGFVAAIRGEPGDGTRTGTPLDDHERELARQRDDLRAELGEVLGRVSDAMFALDDEWRFTYVNDRAEDLIRRSESELLGRNFWEAFPAARESDSHDRLHEALRTQESVAYEVYAADPERWFRVNAYPSESGISVYFQDVTERRRRERRLQENERRYRALVRNVPGVVYRGAPESPWPMEFLSEDVEALTGYTAAELTDGEVQWEDLMHPDDREPVRRAVADQLEFDGVYRGTYRIRTRDGERRWIRSQCRAVTDESGNARAIEGVFTDVTARKERERRLERYETILETIDDGVYVVDDDQEFVTVNDAYCEITGYDREELLGAHVSLVVDDRTVAAARDGEREMRAGGERTTMEADLRRADGETITAEATFSLLPTEDGTDEVRVGVVRDVTARKERERHLERYETIVESSWDGVYALDPDGDFAMANDAFLEMVGWEREELLGRPAAVVHDADVSSAAGRLAADVWEGDREGARLEFDLRARDGSAVPVESRFGPYPYDGERWGRCGIVRDITERKRRERELKRQREQLAALDDLNSLVQDITHAVLQQSSRDEIESLVCERLAAAESYEFAWVGAADLERERVTLRTESGVEGYLEDISIPLDDGVEELGPTGRAVLTQRAQVTRDAFEDPNYAEWRDHAREHGFRASVAVPITYEGTLYGVLNVYSARRGAFDDDERTILSRLGDVVGHAINALERKQALLSDERVELDFRLRDVLGDETPTDGEIRFERTVPVDGDTYLEYGTVTDDGVETLRAVVKAFPHFESLAFLDEAGDERRFELRLSEPPAISVLANHGGRVAEAVIADGDYRMTVTVPPRVEVRTILDAIEDAYPDIDFVAQRQTSRSSGDDRRETLVDRLTERQRATMEAAFFGGYFDWPRTSTAEDLADSMEVSPPTFHHHLRKAQKKVVDGALVGGASVSKS
ncbi:PAS domain S-box protein [Halorussus sp. GCM10023401]|uniref:PAS domain S-box protein n=1 Tax=Halorussus sp. GCM10023401 TaxID=3252680 RepID=UPI0036188E68